MSTTPSSAPGQNPAGQNPAGKGVPVWVFLPVVAASISLGLVIFVALPHIVSEATLGRVVHNRLALSAFEGFLKSCLFVAYIWLIGQKKDIHRLFQYHGAEHKVVFATEEGCPLTPDGARGFGTLHPRCGTNFAVVTIIVSVLLFSLLPRTDSRLVSVFYRFLCMPLVAGLSYEVIKLTVHPTLGRFALKLMTPGLWLQRLTTQKPDDSQLEVSCAAMVAVIEAEKALEAESLGVESVASAPIPTPATASG